jgi:hypothetical protein
VLIGLGAIPGLWTAAQMPAGSAHPAPGDVVGAGGPGGGAVLRFDVVVGGELAGVWLPVVEAERA